MLFNFEGLFLKTFMEKTERTLYCTAVYGGVAQMGEHLPCKQGVKGSIPFISTTRGTSSEQPFNHRG